MTDSLCVYYRKKAISNPENLYESERFEQMPQELSEKFDYVILDTAPTGIVRDAEIIADMHRPHLWSLSRMKFMQRQ